MEFWERMSNIVNGPSIDPGEGYVKPSKARSGLSMQTQAGLNALDRQMAPTVPLEAPAGGDTTTRGPKTAAEARALAEAIRRQLPAPQCYR